MIFSMSGVLCSLSHLDTDCRDTPIMFASSSCEMPFCFLKLRILSAISILAIPPFVILDVWHFDTKSCCLIELYHFRRLHCKQFYYKMCQPAVAAAVN